MEAIHTRSVIPSEVEGSPSDGALHVRSAADSSTVLRGSAAPAARNDTCVRVAVAGATGYAGAELASILKKHPHAELVAEFSSESFSVDALKSSNAEVVFLATPNEVSAELAPKVLDLGMKVVDLSGAFRLKEPNLYPKWYGFAHERPELLGEAAYGLTEWCNGELAKARLVANPGCYPTSILLALRPLAYLIDREQPVIIDAKSGVSGAGKKADVAYSFAELFGNFKAYGVGNHRHEPEIRQGLHLGDRATLVFVPHLLPTVRGILSTMHVGFTHAVSDEELTQIFAKQYASSPFVKILKAGQLPELKDVVNTPHCHIGWKLMQGGRRAVIVSVIDNLLKGAASQAVQNFNRMHGFPETEGLQ